MNFISNLNGNSDPVYFMPSIGNAAQVSIQCPLGAAQQIATGTIPALGFVAKNRTTPALLQANTGATAIDQLIVNTTHPSRAWTYKSIGAGVFSISQPLVPSAVFPNIFAESAEVDSWIATDAVTVYAPVTVNIAHLSANLTDINGGFNNYISVYNCSIGQPAGSNVSDFAGGIDIFLVESSSARCVVFNSNVTGILNPYITNSDLINGLQTTNSGAQPYIVNTAQNTMIVGGIIKGSVVSLNSTLIDADIILTSSIGQPSGSTMTWGSVYIETGKTLTFGPEGNSLSFNGYGNTPFIWGPGNLNVIGASKLVYPSAGGAAVATFLLKGTMHTNGGSTAYSVSAGAGAVWNGGITVNQANLDAAEGPAGFGGLAVNPGGSSIANTGQ